MKDNFFDIFEQKRQAELNLYSKALERLQKENAIFKQAESRYSEFVHNQNWRDWIGINYNKILENYLKENDSENFNNEKIFDKITNFDKYSDIYRMFSTSKEILDYFQPKTTEDLAICLAIGNGTKSKYILELIQKGGFETKTLNKITKDTFNLVLYTEQLKTILNKIYKDKNEADFIFKILYSARYSCDLIEILRNHTRKKDFSIVNYIKKENIIEYTNHLKIACTSLKDALNEKDEQELETTINAILLGVIISCKKSEAIKCAKKLYEFVSLKTK